MVRTKSETVQANLDQPHKAFWEVCSLREDGGLCDLSILRGDLDNRPGGVILDQPTARTP